MPTSSLCTQLCVPMGLAGQSMSLFSVPAHWTLSKKISSLPLTKPKVRAIAPVISEEDDDVQ